MTLLILRALKLAGIAVCVLVLAAMLLWIVALLTEQPQRAVPVAIFASAAVVIVSVTVAVVGGALRRRRTTMILTYLEQAVRLNLPLPSLFDAIGQTEHGTFALQMQQARQWLERGMPLAEVLRAVCALPQRVFLLIEQAERAGRLPQALGGILRQHREAMARRQRWPAFYVTYYPFLIAIAVVVFTSLLMVFVMPKFEQMFRDFKTDLPWETTITIGVARWLDGVGMIVLLALLIGLAIRAATARLRGRPGISESWSDRFVTNLPWIGTVQMHRALGDVLSYAADAMEAGQPAPTALAEASRVTANARVRMQVGQMNLELANGRAIADAARAADMPPLVCGMLGTAAQTANLPEVLRFLGRYYATRFSRALAMLEAAAIPAAAVTMGLVVGWIALSLFAPMIALINSVAPAAQGF